MCKVIFRNENCEQTMKHMQKKNIKVDCILTSPPYNISKCVKVSNAKSVKNRDVCYDMYVDDKTDDEYIKWTARLFEYFDVVLRDNGVVLYNMSYGNGSKSNKCKPNELMWRVVAYIIEYTNFTVADRIVWKKSIALPNNRSKNKLTRIVEDIFVFVRKKEYLTFYCNKKVLSISNGAQRKGQKSYENIYNFIEAKNNNESCPLNKATYSIELCTQLLNIYCPDNGIVYDPFSGTGTTAIGCKVVGRNIRSINSELSARQVQWSRERWDKY